MQASQTAASNDAAPRRRETENRAPAVCESGLLRYKSWWEHKEADIFVNSRVLTGVPIFTAPDTLRVVSGECSRFVPLEQVTCIRIPDRLSTC